jgi:hypothetical protein
LGCGIMGFSDQRYNAMAERIERPEDDFFTERIALFTARFPNYYREPQQIHGRFHASDEPYFDGSHEIIPLTQRRGHRTYVMMHPYVREPKLTFIVGLYSNPKHYADQESPIGEVIGSQPEGFREAQVGNAQAWYYPADKALVLWECFFEDRFRKHPLPEDTNMQKLWQSFEHYLLTKFPQTSTLATPFNDPIAASIEEYQAFLTTLGYSPLVKGAFGKRISTI